MSLFPKHDFFVSIKTKCHYLGEKIAFARKMSWSSPDPDRQSLSRKRLNMSTVDEFLLVDFVKGLIPLLERGLVLHVVRISGSPSDRVTVTAPFEIGL